MNVWNGIGRVVKEAEIRETANTKLINFTIAVDNPFKKEGTKADFLNCVAFGKTAEFFDRYLNVKGLRVGVTGSIQTRTWEDKEGKKHNAVEIMVNNLYFADAKANTSPKYETSSEEEFSLI